MTDVPGKLLDDFVAWLDLNTAVTDFLSIRANKTPVAVPAPISALVDALFVAVSCRGDAEKLKYKVDFSRDKTADEAVLARLASAEAKLDEVLSDYISAKR